MLQAKKSLLKRFSASGEVLAGIEVAAQNAIGILIFCESPLQRAFHILLPTGPQKLAGLGIESPSLSLIDG